MVFFPFPRVMLVFRCDNFFSPNLFFQHGYCYAWFIHFTIDILTGWDFSAGLTCFSYTASNLTVDHKHLLPRRNPAPIPNKKTIHQTLPPSASNRLCTCGAVQLKSDGTLGGSIAQCTCGYLDNLKQNDELDNPFGYHSSGLTQRTPKVGTGWLTPGEIEGVRNPVVFGHSVLLFWAKLSHLFFFLHACFVCVNTNATNTHNTMKENRV